MSDQAAQSQLRSIVERVERLDEEIAGLNGDKRDLFAEAKANGFDVKALKAVLGIRRKDASERSEHNAIVALYLATLGMADAADEIEQNDPRTHVHVQAHPHTRGNEAARGDQGDGVKAATAAPSQSVEKIAPDVTAEGDGSKSATGPAPVEGVGSNLPEGASESGSRTRCCQPQAKPPTGGDNRRDGIDDTCRDADGPAGPRARSGVTAGESPGTLSPERAARLAAYEAKEAERRRHRPLPPEGSPLREIILAAREGRSIGVPVADQVPA